MTGRIVYQVAEILEQIGNESSKLGKEQIIRDNMSDVYFKEALRFLYSPYIVTNISTKKLSKELSGVGEEIDSFHDYMCYLKNSTGKDIHVLSVKNFLNKCMESVEQDSKELVQWLIEGMACKNIKVGITATTINKVYGDDFIPQFKVMLAEKWLDYDKKKDLVKENWRELEGRNVFGTLKIDGNRLEAFVDYTGKVTLFSREGKIIEGCVDIENACSVLERGQVYEGEVLALGEFKNANERFKKTSSIMRSKGEKTGIELIVFDLIPLDVFQSGVVDIANTCSIRKAKAKEILSGIDSEYVRYLEPLYDGVFDKELLDVMADELKANGEEGLMVQCADSPYEFKRVKHLLKCKSFESADIKCIDVYEGKTGQNIGRLGGIICNYKGDSVRVGGGFSGVERDGYWENPSKIVGKIIEVKYFEEFLSEDGTYDLRFATFKSVRDDKEMESYH